MSTNRSALSNYQGPASEEITRLAWEFLKEREGTVFKRSEINQYILGKGKFSEGELTGSMNRLLRVQASVNSIELIKTGFYRYNPSNQKSITTLSKKVHQIFEKAFTDAEKIINAKQISELNKEELEELKQLIKVLELKETINNILL